MAEKRSDWALVYHLTTLPSYVSTPITGLVELLLIISYYVRDETSLNKALRAEVLTLTLC